MFDAACRRDCYLAAELRRPRRASRTIPRSISAVVVGSGTGVTLTLKTPLGGA